jgi:benzoyl-CoA reductase/2-hydroxyglutaryl-CoA dehydratase subunit BcrC/BadD/HgdB
MKRVLRETANKGQSIPRLREHITDIQRQFNELIEKMTLAKITLEQLEQGADSVEVNFHTDTTEDYAEY